MSFKCILHCVFALLLLPLSVAVKAQTEAHVHGLATLMMALEGDVVEIQLESPAANFVGFEHKATTEDEIHAAEKAEALLESPQGLFSFSGSSCELQDMAVDLSSVMDSDHHEEHHEEDHHDEHHDEHEAHDDHEDHGDEHETADAHDDHQDHGRHDDENEHHDGHEEIADAHDEHEGHDEHDEHEGHSEITANYHFTCDNIAKISSVSVALFEKFPGLEKIHAMWVTEAQQGAEILTAESTNIPLR